MSDTTGTAEAVADAVESAAAAESTEAAAEAVEAAAEAVEAAAEAVEETAASEGEETSPAEAVNQALELDERLRNIVREEVGTAVGRFYDTVSNMFAAHHSEHEATPEVVVVEAEPEPEPTPEPEPDRAPEPTHPWFRPLGKRK